MNQPLRARRDYDEPQAAMIKIIPTEQEEAPCPGPGPGKGPGTGPHRGEGPEGPEGQLRCPGCGAVKAFKLASLQRTTGLTCPKCGEHVATSAIYDPANEKAHD